MNAETIARRLREIGATIEDALTREAQADAIEHYQCDWAVCCRDERGKPLTFKQALEKVWGNAK